MIRVRRIMLRMDIGGGWMSREVEERESLYMVSSPAIYPSDQSINYLHPHPRRVEEPDFIAQANAIP